jgi:hypothetical protein
MVIDSLIHLRYMRTTCMQVTQLFSWCYCGSRSLSKALPFLYIQNLCQHIVKGKTSPLHVLGKILVVIKFSPFQHLFFLELKF